MSGIDQCTGKGGFSLDFLPRMEYIKKSKLDIANQLLPLSRYTDLPGERGADCNGIHQFSRQPINGVFLYVGWISIYMKEEYRTANALGACGPFMRML